MAVVAVAAALLSPSAGHSASEVPRGFGAATFGTSVATLKELFPKARLVGKTESGEAYGIAAYELEGQSVIGLEPCTVQFSFGFGNLYQVSFDCGRDEKVVRALKEHFGDPNMDRGELGVFWYGDPTVISLNPVTKVFAFVDRARNENVQKALLSAVLAGGVPRTPSPGATPAGDPAQAPESTE